MYFRFRVRNRKAAGEKCEAAEQPAARARRVFNILEPQGRRTGQGQVPRLRPRPAGRQFGHEDRVRQGELSSKELAAFKSAHKSADFNPFKLA